MVERQNVRILIVEDDFLVCEMIKGLLGDIGYVVVGEAANGREAVELVTSLTGTPAQPDAILMDIAMPELNGIEATKQILERCPTPVVALTAYETRELAEQLAQAGIGAYLVKPSNAREVERAVTVAMARFQDMVTLRQLCAELRTRNQELEEALAQVKTLRGLLPICSSCKKIRTDEGYWQQLDIYVHEHTEAQFTHGLCPDCQRRLYPPETYPFLYEDDK